MDTGIVELRDVERCEGTETGLFWALRNKMSGFATDTLYMLHKFGDGTIKKYPPVDIINLYGATGVAGMRGVTGPAGVDVTGYTGAQGYTGLQGATGLSGGGGSQGATGAQGYTGAQGIQGTQGVQGIQGVQGNAGAQGATGVQGAAGSQGIQGATGAMAPNQMSGSGTSDNIPLFNGTNSLTNSKLSQSGSWISIDGALSVTGMIRGGLTLVRNSLVTPNDHSGNSMGVTGGEWYQVATTNYSDYMPWDMGDLNGKIVANYAGTYMCNYDLSVSCNAQPDNSDIIETRMRRYDQDTSEYLYLYSYTVNNSTEGYQHMSGAGFINLVAGSTLELQIMAHKTGTIYCLNQRFSVFRIGVTQL